MRVMIAGGGTGGHFYPALAVIEELRNREPDAQVAYVGTRRGIEARVLPSIPSVRFFPIHARGMERGSKRQNLWALMILALGFLETLAALIRFRPHVVIGVGGYSSFPALLIASLAGRILPIRTVIHEQNAIAGMANRILARFVDLVLVSYPQTREEFSASRRVVITGNPVRDGFADAARTQGVYYSFGLDPEKLTVLVFGGSGGAATLIEQIVAAKDALASDEEMQVLLVTGSAGEPNRVRRELAAAGVENVVVRTYIDRMADAFAIADLIVSRAGATTLAEITACGKPSLLIPWRGATDDHQWKNACALQAEEACAVADEDVIVRQGLVNLVRDLVRDGDALHHLASNAWRLGQRQAKGLIVGEIDALLKGVGA